MKFKTKTKQSNKKQKRRRSMKTHIKNLALVLLAIVSLTACGGGGGSSDEKNPNNPEKIITHFVTFSDGSVVIELNQNEAGTIDIVVNGDIATTSSEEIDEIIWNDGCGGKNATIFVNNPTTITGLNASGGIGYVSIKLKNGIISFLNTDFIETNGTIDKTKGLISYGDGNPNCQTDPVPLPITPPEIASIKWKIQFHAGSMIVQIPIDEKDYVVNIVDANGVETIPKDDIISVSWNGKCAWPTSTVAFAGNPITITGVDSSGDTGLITIATVDKIYSANIDFIDTIGSTVPVSVDKVNGLIAYGDGDPECPWELN